VISSYATLPHGDTQRMKIIVVGGGILGASTGFHLAYAGADVTIVDRSDEGRATSAGAGIICPWASRGTDPDYYEISRRGARYYPELVAMLAELGETDVSYRRVGGLSVPGNTEALDAQERNIRDRAALAREAGEVTRLTPTQAQALFPPLRKDWGAVHISGAARVDGRKMAAALIRAAVMRGAQLVTADAALQLAESRVSGVTIAGKAMEADAVVICAGAWARPLLREFGVTINVEPQKGQIVHLGLSGVDTRSWPVVLPFSDHYLLSFDDSRVVIGATRETGSGFDCRITAGGVAEVLREALGVAPGLATATLIETRIGFRPLSPDRKPLLGRIPGVDGLAVGTGLGSNGLTMGPYCGRLLSELVLGQQPDLDLTPYDPLR
jgi:D-amino-acid dehydrogenase